MNEFNKDGGIFEQLARVQWLLHRYRLQKYRDFGPMGDPHRGQGRVLSLLKLQPEISQKDLGYLLNMRPQSLGELLTKLERAGFITRAPSAADRRILNIKLTEEGKKAADRKDPTDIEDLLDCLNDQEQATFSEHLNRIIESLEKFLDEEQPDPGFGFGWGFGGPPHHGFDGPPPGTERHHNPFWKPIHKDFTSYDGHPEGPEDILPEN
jgi:DNA-binding MarR family transcriptional regulator